MRISAARLRGMALLALCGPLLACADMAQTAAVLSDAVLRNEAAKRQAEVNRNAAGAVQVVASQPQVGGNGQGVLRVQVANRSGGDVVAIALRVAYLNGRNVIAQDTSCAGQFFIGRGRAEILNCPFFQVQGANSYRVDVTNVQFR